MKTVYTSSFFLLFTIFSVISCALAQSTPNQEKIRAAIKAANGKWMQAAAAKDAAGVAAMYTKDGWVLPPNVLPCKGLAAIEKFWQGELASVSAVVLEVVQLEAVNRDTAWEVGKFRVKGAGGVGLDDGSYIVIWKKVGETWKMHRDIWNSDRPSAKPAPQAVKKSE
jgi:uncharacterized protein (TIGR02246 family)